MPSGVPKTLGCIGVLLLGLVTASAAVRFDVFIGYDNVVPEARWFPVVFEIQNDGPTFEGVVEIEPTAFSDAQVRRMRLELPTGTLKRFVIPCFNSSRGYVSWTARLRDANGRVRAENQNMRPRAVVSWKSPLIGSMARSSRGHVQLPKCPDDRNSSLYPQVARVQPSLFPDTPLAMEGLHALYLNPEQAARLKVNQVRALLAWLHEGGHLVVSVTQPEALAAVPWLKSLMPCDLGEFRTRPVGGTLHHWLTAEQDIWGQPIAERPLQFDGVNQSDSSQRGPTVGTNPFADLEPDPALAGQAIPTVALRPLRGRVLAEWEQDPLMVDAPVGRGHLTVLGFSPELEPLRSWKLLPYFWYKLTDLPPELLLKRRYQLLGYWSVDGVFGAMTQTRQIRKLPVGALLLLLVAYLAVIGPIDRYSLKRLRREMLTWITFPIYVVAFSALIYLIGYVLRAGVSEWNEMHVVDVTPIGTGERADLRGRVFASAYAPANARYEVQCGERYATLRAEYMRNAYQGGSLAGKAIIEHVGNRFRGEIFVPVWTSQLYVGDWWREDTNPLELTVERGSNGLIFEIANWLPESVSSARVVFGQNLYFIKQSIRPNQTVRFEASSLRSMPLREYVRENASQFEVAVQRRQQAFGGEGWLDWTLDHVVAASFLDVIHASEAFSAVPNLPPPVVYQYSGERRFVAPSGFDLTSAVKRGYAVLLAWQSNVAPIPPLKQSSSRRGQRHTLWRVVTLAAQEETP